MAQKMVRALQKELREFIRTKFPEVVERSTFYYHSPGVKFWMIRFPKGQLEKTVNRIKTAVDREFHEQQLQVNGGYTDNHGTSTALYIRHRGAPALATFSEADVQARIGHVPNNFRPKKLKSRPVSRYVWVQRQELIDLRDKIDNLLGM